MIIIIRMIITIIIIIIMSWLKDREVYKGSKMNPIQRGLTQFLLFTPISSLDLS